MSKGQILFQVKMFIYMYVCMLCIYTHIYKTDI